MTTKQYFVSKIVTLRPSLLVLMFLINMVHQIKVGSIGKKTKKSWPERSKTQN